MQHLQSDVTSPDVNIVVNIEEPEKDELKAEEEEPKVTGDKVTGDKDQHDGAKEKVRFYTVCVAVSLYSSCLCCLMLLYLVLKHDLYIFYIFLEGLYK